MTHCTMTNIIVIIRQSLPKLNTVETAYSGTARDRTFPVAGRLRVIKVLEFWIFGTHDPRGP